MTEEKKYYSSRSKKRMCHKKYFKSRFGKAIKLKVGSCISMVHSHMHHSFFTHPLHYNDFFNLSTLHWLKSCGRTCTLNFLLRGRKCTLN